MKRRVFGPVMVVIFLASLISVAAAQESCPAPEGMKVILLESNWIFDPATGLLNGTATVLNTSDSDAVVPGVMFNLYNMKGELFDSVTIRGKQPRVAPGEKTEVPFEIKLKEIPLSVMIAPVEGMAFT
ncbi:MAG: hypothetical protein ACP5CD_05110 [Thermovirgaceae bacterium]